MYYEKHLFFCENQKEAGKKCCALGDSHLLRAYAKEQLRDLNLLGVGKIRVSGSGCLGRCQLGPALVVYPEGTWYHIESKADIDEIIQSHLIQGQPVTRLLMPKEKPM